MDSKPVALITGASRGIGRAAAQALAGIGYRLALTARNRSGLEQTSIDCGADDAVLLPADLLREGTIEFLIDECLNLCGRLDVLINNAGIVCSGSMEESSEADWDEVMTLNARVPFFLTRKALPALRRSPRATIINIGSVVSLKGYPLQSIYSASKHALAGWTKALAREVAGSGIRVHLIAPGGVATDLVKHVRPDIDETELIQPEEIGRAVLFLIQNRTGNGVIDILDIRRESNTPFP